MTTTTAALDSERADLLAMLSKSRHFLRFTTRELTDEEAGRRTTASELTLGGLIKHVTLVERNWVSFVVNGPAAMGGSGAMADDAVAAWQQQFQLQPGETLAGVLADYASAVAATDELVRTLPDLDVTHPLPPRPWFQPGERWSARRVFLHIIAETAQHSGHADIIRESLDGAKSMG